jgi:hypothetical protein
VQLNALNGSIVDARAYTDSAVAALNASMEVELVRLGNRVDEVALAAREADDARLVDIETTRANFSAQVNGTISFWLLDIRRIAMQCHSMQCYVIFRLCGRVRAVRAAVAVPHGGVRCSG